MEKKAVLIRLLTAYPTWMLLTLNCSKFGVPFMGYLVISAPSGRPHSIQWEDEHLTVKSWKDVIMS